VLETKPQTDPESEDVSAEPKERGGVTAEGVRVPKTRDDVEPVPHLDRPIEGDRQAQMPAELS
jgi:hypothetical protein